MANAHDLQSGVSDEELAARLRDQKDLRAFEALVHRYEKPLYNYLYRYLGDAQMAEDVFQATFFRVYERCHLFTDERKFRPWLYTMATHRAVDALRKEGRHQAASLDQERSAGNAEAANLLGLLESEIESPLEQVEEAERRVWTRRAVENLPEHQRVVILLIYFQGLKYREAAEVLDLPVGTVKSRVHKALAALNEAWRREHAQEKD